MKETTELERRRAAMLKARRSAIRLKYSLMADDEIARDLPAFEAEIDAAISAGKMYELSPGDVFTTEGA